MTLEELDLEYVQRGYHTAHKPSTADLPPGFRVVTPGEQIPKVGTYQCWNGYEGQFENWIPYFPVYVVDRVWHLIRYDSDVPLHEDWGG